MGSTKGSIVRGSATAHPSHEQAEQLAEQHLGRSLRADEQVIASTTGKPHFHVQPAQRKNFRADDDVLVVDMTTQTIRQGKWQDIAQWPRQEFDGGAWRIFPPKENGLQTIKEAA